MLDSFGARYFELTVNDLKGEKLLPPPHRTAPGLRANIAAILTEASERQQTLSLGLAARSCSSTTSLTLLTLAPCSHIPAQ